MYYICNLYNLLFLGFCVCGLIYVLIQGDSTSDLWKIQLTIIGFSFVGLKSILSLKMVGLYKNNKSYKKADRAMFIIGYSLSAVLVILTSLFVYSFIKYAGPRAYYMEAESILILATIILFFTLLYTVLFDFPLLKAIRNNTSFATESIGTDISQS